MGELLLPAIEAAENGVVVNPLLHDHIGRNVNRYNPAAARIFLPGGKVPRVGTVLKQDDLAKTLRAIAKDGPAPFYTGEIAEEMLRALKEVSSLITAEDLRT